MKTMKRSLLLVGMSCLFTLFLVTFTVAQQAGTPEKRTDAKMTYGTENGTRTTFPGMNPGMTRVNDGDLEDAVEKAVAHYEDVDVDVEKGVVTLSGEVPNEANRRGAIEAARAVPGVISVHDQMQVKGTGSQSAGEYLDDTGITAAVKGKIFATKNLSSLAISVDTHDGVVTLTGTVTSKDLADRAGRVAARVNGVKRVDNKLLVQP